MTIGRPIAWDFDDSWDSVPFPQLTKDQVRAILRRHALPVGIRDVRPLPSTGVLNTIIAIGDKFVLRVPKNMSEGLSDTYTEAVAAPVARSVGVRTPELIAFDDSREIVDVHIRSLSGCPVAA